MDPVDLLTRLLAQMNPALVPVLGGSAVAVRQIVALLKRRYPKLHGNVVQSIAGGISLLVVGAEGLSCGAFQHAGPQALEGYILASAAVWAMSVFAHELMTDRNARPA